ncbi:hypothetical protein V8F33_012887 [Rhypophila sp. PSN 637]
MENPHARRFLRPPMAQAKLRMTELKFLPHDDRGVPFGFAGAAVPTRTTRTENKTPRQTGNSRIKIWESNAKLDQPNALWWDLGRGKRTSQELATSRHQDQMVTDDKPTSPSTPRHQIGRKPEKATQSPGRGINYHDTNSEAPVNATSMAESRAQSRTESHVAREVSRGHPEVLTVNPVDVEHNPAHNIAWWLQGTDHHLLLAKLKPTQIAQAARVTKLYRQGLIGLDEFSSIWPAEEKRELEKEPEKRVKPAVVSQPEQRELENETEKRAEPAASPQPENREAGPSPTTIPAIASSTVVLQGTGENETNQAPKRPMSAASEGSPRKRQRKAQAVPPPRWTNSLGTPPSMPTPIAEASSTTPAHLSKSPSVNDEHSPPPPTAETTCTRISSGSATSSPLFPTNRIVEEREDIDWEMAWPTTSSPGTAVAAAQPLTSFEVPLAHITAGSPGRQTTPRPYTPSKLRESSLAASPDGQITTAASALSPNADPAQQTGRETPARQPSIPTFSPFNQTTALMDIIQQRQTPVPTPVLGRSGIATQPATPAHGNFGPMGNMNFISGQTVAHMPNPAPEPLNSLHAQINQDPRLQRHDAFGHPQIIHSGLRNPELGGIMFHPTQNAQTEAHALLQMQNRLRAEAQLRALTNYNRQQAALVAAANANATSHPANMLGSNPQTDALARMMLSPQMQHQQNQIPHSAPGTNFIAVERNGQVTPGTPSMGFPMNQYHGAGAFTTPGAGMMSHDTNQVDNNNNIAAIRAARIHQMRMELQRKAQESQQTPPGGINKAHVASNYVSPPQFPVGIMGGTTGTPTARNPTSNLQQQQHQPMGLPQPNMHYMSPPSFMLQSPNFTLSAHPFAPSQSQNMLQQSRQLSADPFAASPGQNPSQQSPRQMSAGQFAQSSSQNNTSYPSPQQVPGLGDAQGLGVNPNGAADQRAGEMYDFMAWD